LLLTNLLAAGLGLCLLLLTNLLAAGLGLCFLKRGGVVLDRELLVDPR